MATSKKRRYDNISDSSGFIRYEPTRERRFYESVNQHRYTMHNALPLVYETQLTYDLAEATQSVEIMNISINGSISYNANTTAVGEMFDGIPTPKVSWVVAIVPANGEGKLLSPDGSGDFYVPEQKMYRGGILYCSPTPLDDYKLTQESIINWDSIPVIPVQNVHLVVSSVPPADVIGRVHPWKFTNEQTGDLISLDKPASTKAVTKTLKIQAYGGPGIPLKHGDRLVLILNSNFTADSSVFLTLTCFFDEIF